MKLRSLAFMIAFSGLACMAISAQTAARSRFDHESHLRVMTYNLNEGTDYQQVQGVTTLTQFLLGVGQIITQVRATNPPERMQAIATQILAARPTLISLQEADQWSTGPFNPSTGTCGPMQMEFDMLRDLMNALQAGGGHYEVAVQAQQYAFPPTPGLIPPATFVCAAVMNYNLILARTDLDPEDFQWSNSQSAQFVHIVTLPTPIGPLPLPRVWVSVDAQFHGHAFRLIGTHLEPVPQFKQLQGAELRAGPANTSLPVIVAMDSNAQAFPFPQDPTYLDFMAAGYNDTWSTLFPLAPGLTCCQAELDNNPISQLSARIDLILTLGNIRPKNAAIFGADPFSKTPSGLWPSDHAGVAVRLKVSDDETD
jgi:hypothetical protein